MRTAPGRHRSEPGRIAGALTVIPRTRPAPDTGATAAASKARAVNHEDVAWTGRILRTLAGIFVITWSFRLSGYLTFASWLAIPVTLLGLAGLIAVVSAWLPG